MTAPLWRAAASLVVALGLTGVSDAQVIFFDDFEAYPPSDPADFSATGNWTHNGVGGTDANANRIFFSAPNFGGTTLWIAHPDLFPGTGLISRGVDVEPDTDYEFTANLVAETFAGARDNEFSVDLLLGDPNELIFATSLIGGPQTVIGRGDGGDGIPAGAIDDSYADQITRIPFSTAAVGAGEQLIMLINYVGPGPSGNPGFAGVDNVGVRVIPEPGTAVLGLALLGLVAIRRN